MGVQDERRWILGFDAGCTTCSGVARQIEAISAGKLTAFPLSSSRLVEWRLKLLGPNAPWLPTLFEVQNTCEAKRAWSGRSMIPQMLRILGPAKTWEIAKLFGGGTILSTENLDEVANLGRRRVTKGLAGSALALAALSGKGVLRPMPTAAAGYPPSGRKATAYATSSKQALNQRAESFRQWNDIVGSLPDDNFVVDSDSAYRVDNSNGTLYAKLYMQNWKDIFNTHRRIVMYYTEAANGTKAAIGLAVTSNQFQYFLKSDGQGNVTRIVPTAYSPGSTATLGLANEANLEVARELRFTTRLAADAGTEVGGEGGSHQTAAQECSFCQYLCGGACFGGAGLAVFGFCGLTLLGAGYCGLVVSGIVGTVCGVEVCNRGCSDYCSTDPCCDCQHAPPICSGGNCYAYGGQGGGGGGGFG